MNRSRNTLLPDYANHEGDKLINTYLPEYITRLSFDIGDGGFALPPDYSSQRTGDDEDGASTRAGSSRLEGALDRHKSISVDDDSDGDDDLDYQRPVKRDLPPIPSVSERVSSSLPNDEPEGCLRLSEIFESNSIWGSDGELAAEGVDADLEYVDAHEDTPVASTSAVPGPSRHNREGVRGVDPPVASAVIPRAPVALPKRPKRNVVYTFQHVRSSAMVVLPPPDAAALGVDSKPPYYIAVRMNCFIPTAHVTTVYRGADRRGEVVAKFEMGIMQAESRVQMGNDVNQISEVLFKKGGHASGQWTWVLPRKRTTISAMHDIHWDFTKRPCVCTSTSVFALSPKVLARFYPHTGNSLQAQSALEVTPAGHGMFDEILTSVLIIERKRLSPSKGDLKALFS